MLTQAGSDGALLTVEEVARLLDVQPVTVYRWCRHGRLRCLKPGKAWRIRRVDLDVFLQQSRQPRTLREYLNRFLAVPDQVVAVAEDEELLTELDAAFFQVAQARRGLLIKIYDPRTVSWISLKTDLRRHGVVTDRWETSGRLRWCPACDVDEGIASLQRAAEEAETTEQTIWANMNWPSGNDFAQGVQQQDRLTALIAAHPQVVVVTGVVEPEPKVWSSLINNWQLPANIGGLIRVAYAGLLFISVAPPLPA